MLSEYVSQSKDALLGKRCERLAVISDEMILSSDDVIITTMHAHYYCV